MINVILSKLSAVLAGLLALITPLGVTSLPPLASSSDQSIYADTQSADASFGAALPGGEALFETALRERLDRTSTSSMTLIENSLRGSSALSGYHCFTVDEGRSDQEFICGTVSGTTVSALERGISFDTGTTSTTSLQYAHRVGANVKVTDYPLIQRMQHILAGTDPGEYIIKYASSISTSSIGSDDRNLANVDYVNSVAFNGASVVSASESARGVVELATQTEMASSTTTGGSGALVLQSKYATSSAPSSGHYVPVTQSNGDLSEGFIPTTLANAYTFSATTTFSSKVVFSGDTSGVASTTLWATTTTGTWTKPAGLNYIILELVGGGGAGGGENGTADYTGGGGGAGGYCRSVIAAASLPSTVTVTVGAGGVGDHDGGAAGGTTKFNGFATSTGGGGATGNSPGVAAGGTGGTCTAGKVAVTGGGGTAGYTNSTAHNSIGGAGGSSYFGGGAAAVTAVSTGSSAGLAGAAYGSGGSGAVTANSASAQNGGDGKGGIVIVTEVF